MSDETKGLEGQILNSATTGEADFIGAVKAGLAAVATQQEEPVKEPEVVDEPKKAEPEPRKEPAAEKEPVKEKVNPTKKEVEDVTKTDDDIPVNPHFKDKGISDKPPGESPSEKEITAWAEAKAEIKRIREERDRLAAEAKVAKEEVAKVSSTEIEDLKQQIEDYKTRSAELERSLKAADIERTPEYIEQIKKPIENSREAVKSIAEANDADFGKLWQAITEPDIRKRTDSLEELIGDFKRMEQLEIVKIADKFQDITTRKERFNREAEYLLENERARLAQKDQEFIENDLRLQKTFTQKTWTNLEDRYDFLREIDGQDDWNKQIRQARVSASETNLDRLTVEDRSTILARAAVVPFLESAVRHYSAQVSEIEAKKDAKISELESQLQSLVKSTPSIGGSPEDKSYKDDIDPMNPMRGLGEALLGRR